MAGGVGQIGLDLPKESLCDLSGDEPFDVGVAVGLVISVDVHISTVLAN